LASNDRWELSGGRKSDRRSGNVPKWETENGARKAQYVVVVAAAGYKRLQKWVSPVRTDRRKTGVNTGDFGCLPKKKIKNSLDSK
jgi:hypothetical protein